MISSKTNNPNSGTFQSLPVFLVCLLAAAVFWLLRALSGIYYFQTEIPYKLLDLPENQMLHSPGSGLLPVSLNCNGYNHLAYTWFRDFDTVYLDARSGLLANNRLKFDRSKLNSRLNVSIPGKFTLSELGSDSLVFSVEQVLRKKVKIKPLIHYRLSEEMALLKPISIEPASIYLKGPQSSFKDLKYIATPDTELGVLNGALQIALPLIIPEGVKAETDTVLLSLFPEKLVERTFQIPLQKGTKMQSDSIKVTLRVPISKADASVLLLLKPEIEPQQNLKGKIVFKNLPPYLRVINIEPAQVALNKL
jgi:hypothetical protein